MDLILQKYGFVKDESTDTWIKGIWTVNFDNELIEFSQDFDTVEKPKYFVGRINEIDVEAILQDII